VPPKAKIPAPIDRPLSRAYLREFTGWSTNYPPGVSDSTSLRVMENMLVQRDGSIRIRPGLRYLSYVTVPTEEAPVGQAIANRIIGTHEAFFLNDGSKAYLFAVREADGLVGFRVLAQTTAGQVVISLTDAGFSIPQGESGEGGINMDARTTYVKYLQIDNKVFALSDAGLMIRQFTVGSTKTAKRLYPISRPEWATADKLEVVHPEAAWVNSGDLTNTRYNRAINPTFETNLTNWTPGGGTAVYRTGGVTPKVGTWTVRLTSEPTRTNLMPRTLYNAVATGIAGWTQVSAAGTASTDTPRNALKVAVDPGKAGTRAVVYGPYLAVAAGKDYEFSFDLVDVTNLKAFGVIARYYNSANVQVGSDIYHAQGLAENRHVVYNMRPPTGASKLRIFFYGDRNAAAGAASFSVKNLLHCPEAEASTFFYGGSGANYFWDGAVNASASYYHPPRDVSIRTSVYGSRPIQYTASAYIRGTVPRSGRVDFSFYSTNALISTSQGPARTETAADWERAVHTATAPAGTTNVLMWVVFPAVPRGEYHYVDAVLIEEAAAAGGYFDGGSGDTPALQHNWNTTAHASYSRQRAYSVGTTVPKAAAKTANTLRSNAAAKNTYNFAFFYTISNELGESAASPVTIVKAQRSWSAWQWEIGNAAAEPGGTETADPVRCADQLVAIMPPDVFASAIAAGATQWNLYMYTWNDQVTVPVTAMRIATRPLDQDSLYGSDGWARATPSMTEAGDEIATIPTRNTRQNFTDPSRGGQGLVAADRMVIVKDPASPAVIRWTSNQQGSYTDFTASRGGGYKTLTSGNLYVPVCVKLWQNPQSADTITILCKGVDGANTTYYMAPSQIAQQSEAVNVMGFEETTACPGTVAPYGVEVFNNALYHPLDDMLMKSTANNYNITHKGQTDRIENRWQELTRKEWIISSIHDNRLYYIVHNPSGEPLEEGCNGNEIWVFDGGSGGAEGGGGTWSRYLIQAHSLRKVDQAGQLRMSVVRPDGIFYFDDYYGFDDYVDQSGAVMTRAIPWKIETNTQGANRAHDAWAHLQQCNITLGSFSGGMRFGIRSYDLHGKPVEISKETFNFEPEASPVYEELVRGRLHFDIEDYLLIRRDLKEWFFFAESLTDDAGLVRPSAGEITLVQYRYSPVSVNVGYEYGSIETFEYRRAEQAGHDGRPDEFTTNGVPRPYVDVRRP
jgi:hypothetical protein